MSLIDYLNQTRYGQDLLTIDEVIRLSDRGNTIFDPCSVLISKHAVIGASNVFFPGVYLLCEEGAELVVGDFNRFYPNTLLEASGGAIRVGTQNQFGEGGFTAKANRQGASISIGDYGRYINGAAVFGSTSLGSGSQLIGAVTVDSCHLQEGGDFREPDPDKRAGLLKGFGTAKNLTIPAGHVITGSGSFHLDNLVPQSFYHPKA
ncbi:hypothetical protein [Mesorhizobium sp. B1-1-5]|uniref:hypothetical protein n=1 Tax=Mesorhizobium sp. B1-1-5 TaxID=2589979 RepID=UPI0011266E21|nr:hypothetical protein [Mesorhizobium sp. B1-1-5]TPO13746.1 hypothetical protein FJ980_00805 [Mesorhizobium sp. B1-1-5]